MRPKERACARKYEHALLLFQRRMFQLPGIGSQSSRQVFIEQLLESVRRVEYFGVVRSRGLSPSRADPMSAIFDPFLGAATLQDRGDFDEACWLVFLGVHFGRSRRSGWALARSTLGAFGQSKRWDWVTTSRSPTTFRRWLGKNVGQLKATGTFGNHRKYQSLDAGSPTGTGAAVESYVSWVDPKRGHAQLFKDASRRCGNDSRATFDDLYKSMSRVASFGRTARFDYLTMLGKLKLADIEPGSTYMNGATGPLAGARLLFSGNARTRASTKSLEEKLVTLGETLNVGMQVLEDALCNWQKSPNKFIPFRG